MAAINNGISLLREALVLHAQGSGEPVFSGIDALCDLCRGVSRDGVSVAFREALHTLQTRFGADARVFSLLSTALALSVRNADAEAVDEGAPETLVDATLPLALAEDVAEMSTIRDCERLFAWIEDNKAALTRNMLPSKGKGLVLLRICNELLRRLSKTRHTVFCGRILLFLTAAFPLTERSGVNLRGDFNVDNTTVVVQEDLDVDFPAGAFEGMEVDEAPPGVDLPEKQTKKRKPVSEKDMQFHQTFWSLQPYFSHPILVLTNPIEWKKMEAAVEVVLQAFEAENELEFKSVSDRKRKTTSDNGESHNPGGRRNLGTQNNDLDLADEYFFPKFLTSRNLFELQMKDISFRRQIMVQLLIILQFFTNLTKQAIESNHGSALGTKKSLHFHEAVKAGLSADAESWVHTTRSRVVRCLEGTGTNGRRFCQTLTTVVTHEANWIKWKAEGCPGFEKGLKEGERLDVGKRFLEQSLAIRKDFAGSDALSMLSMADTDPKVVLRDPKRLKAAKPLEDLLDPLAEQLNEDGTVAEGVEDEYLLSKDRTFNWRAYRTAMQEHFHLFKEVDNIDTQMMCKRVKFDKVVEAFEPSSTVSVEPSK
ncbi:THO complex, subunit THOC1 [Chytriomyces sp. MP71]|nr:THO complex, subunit THOC1 [Chytriomyces sp. MP71]